MYLDAMCAKKMFVTLIGGDKSYTAQVLKIYCLKAQGHVTVNKPVISMIYIVSHTWPLCSAQILVDGVNPR